MGTPWIDIVRSIFPPAPVLRLRPNGLRDAPFSRSVEVCRQVARSTEITNGTTSTMTRMQQSLLGIELETGGVLLKYVQTAAETNGALHAQEARYPAHSTPPPMHRHPLQKERFVIVEGEVLFRTGPEREERRVRAGEELEVPQGVLHCAYNPGDVPALVIWET